MSGKVIYTDEPMELRVIPDFLPPPEQLFPSEDTVEVTLALSTRSVAFFKEKAKQYNVPYEHVIRVVLNQYTDGQIGPR